ncbi:SGNH/GDSL hydrolase family protein [Microbacterium betulae]|uniref:SGNH/GDSL hydrolase family protein n=1 Tax=Microbacterium betulae TaxID=2981139 RepID=A0AA97I460_9MICO|nr:SGNH/GDSL hydrolase family protein [Microbacterium sp. AB]WOF22261.1 SGNH/GDSL hydrolase family protein [Microbacterium sp. AB]
MSDVIAIFGDSIVEGLGVRGGRYADLVAARTGLRLLDYSVSGSTVADSAERFRAEPADVAYAVIAHGVTEPIPRPRDAALRLLPRRYRRRGWMDPRAYFSRRRWKHVLERVESALRWRTKNVLMACAGSDVLLSIDDYERALRALVLMLEERGAVVLVLGPPHIDARFFPGAPEGQARYAAVAEKVAPHFVATQPGLKAWSDYFADHFHPNDSGHAKLADLVTTWIGDTESRRGRHAR